MGDRPADAQGQARRHERCRFWARSSRLESRASPAAAASSATSYINDKAVSGMHFEVSARDDGYRLSNYGSK